MAKTDPERVRRIIAGLKNPREQACAWAILAHGLADRDKPAARSALVESIRLIDRLRQFAQHPRNRAYGQVMVAINPAASILPIVEVVAPERLEEVFWKAVALMPNDDRVRATGFADAVIAQSAIFLARYDRQVADVFVNQALASRTRSRSGYFPMIVRAKAGVDPRGAVAMIEAMPPIGPNDA